MFNMALQWILLVCLLSTVSGASVEEQFNKWMLQYDRKYSSELESQTRLKIFSENLDLITKHNGDPTKSYKLGVNKFADLSDDEFEKLYLMEPQHCSATGGSKSVSYKDLPKAVDWRRLGAVTPVKNQGQCGSCWTFSTTGCLESHTFLASKNLISLSEQQLVDCAGAFNNNGCNGGLPSQAFEYIHYNGGLESEVKYPYNAHDGTCHFDKLMVAATVNAVVNITAKDEVEMKDAVARKGPVSIAYDVAKDFKLYKNGVYTSTECGKKPDEVNHAVLVVGYNTTVDGTDYWIVKNSWGTTFGMEGYFWIARGSNMCGMADCASYPIV